MANEIRSLRGTHDIFPTESLRWQYIERIGAEVAESYGFEEIRIPTIEKTELFQRSVGDTTDIVQKEMYTFKMGRESITLRPEGTAGIVRAVLQDGILNNSPLPVKFFWTGSLFRHENPQAGRQREFHQFSVECFGAAAPTQDAEVIALADTYLERLGIADTTLHINSIGCSECRPVYNALLKDYYRPLLPKLCQDCQERFERNPLRLLDCKNEQCQPFKDDAPRGLDHLCEPCEEHFDGVKKALTALEIDFLIDPDIVRGLDYYNRTVFEFISDKLGAQSTVCGGGRYDGLVEELGGQPTPALGFGMGLERLLMIMEATGASFPAPTPYALYIGSMGEEENRLALKLATHLRKEGFKVLVDTTGRSVRAQMRYADRLEVQYSCIIGGNEMETGKAELRNMKSGESTEAPLTGDAFAKVLYTALHQQVADSELDITGALGTLFGE